MTQLFLFHYTLTCHITNDHIIFFKMNPLAYWKCKNKHKMEQAKYGVIKCRRQT